MELKNDIQIRGTLKSVDQYLNIKLDDISVVNELLYPHLVSCFLLLDVLDMQQILLFSALLFTLGLRVVRYERL